MSYAQNSQFSQYYSSPTTLGPSFAGLSGESRAVVNFRDQWPSIPGTFLTYAVSVDHYLPKLRSGIAALVYRDQAGAGNFAHTRFGLQYSYDVELDRYWHLRPGLMFAYQQTSLDFYKLVFGDGLKIEGSNSQTITTPPLTSKGYIDFSGSLLVYSSRLWAGATVDHLLQPDESLRNEIESSIPLKFSAYAGYKFLVSSNKRYKLDENIILTFLYKNQASSDQFDLGAYWNKNPLSIGLWVRGLPGFMKTSERYGNLDAFVVLLGYVIGDMKVGYSYDFTISDLIGTTGGAHEISLIYTFKTNLRIKGKKKRGVVVCPQF